MLGIGCPDRHALLRHHLAENAPTATPPPPARAGSLCAGHVQQLGGESPLSNLMEVKD